MIARRLTGGLVLAGLIAVYAVPARTYYDDTHYGLTYFMARTCGYTSMQAHRVASADLSIDYSPRTEPEEYSRMAGEALPGTGPQVHGSQEPRVRFHAFRDNRNATTSRSANAAIERQAAHLWRLGVAQHNLGPYLHFLQDQTAHQGYASAGGHWVPGVDSLADTGLPFGPKTDFLSYKPERADRMVAATLKALERFRAAVLPLQRPRPCTLDAVGAVLRALISASPIPKALGKPAYARANTAVNLALRDDVWPFNPARIDFVFETGGGVQGLTPGSPNPVFGGSVDDAAPTALDAFTLQGALRATVSPARPAQVAVWAAPTRKGEAPYLLACTTTSGTALIPNLPVGDVIVAAMGAGGGVTRQDVVLARLQQNVAIRLPRETAQSQSCAQRAAPLLLQQCASPSVVAGTVSLERQLEAQAASFAACMNATTVSGAMASSLSAIDRQFDDRTRALEPVLRAGEGGLARYDALHRASELAARNAPEHQDVLQQAKDARDSVKLALDLAARMRTQALERLAMARAATEPAVKAEHFRQTLNFVRQSEAQAQRAAADLAPAGGSFTVNSEALKQVKALAKALNAGDVQADFGTLIQGFDAAAKGAGEAVAAQSNAQISNGAPRGYAGGDVTLGDGRTIDVSELERVAGRGAPGPATPLFRSAPGPGRGLVVDPEVYNRAISAPADPGVGGVALQVQLLSLDAAAVPGFRSGVFLEAIDQTVLISLQRLLTRVQPFSSSAQQWASLPAELRFPGGIERIIGYVIDHARHDVILIGSPAARPQSRMDLDALVLALRASWRDGVTPFVSLDASPQNKFGPQLSRVGGGVPQDSVMAKTMLDADYLMKQVLLGTQQTDVAGYRTVVHLEQAESGALQPPLAARFWFYPKPLGLNTVAVSASGRTVTFNAELQLLTEQMATQGAVFTGSRAGAGIEETAALEFTRALEALSTSAKTDPKALFAQLRGLTGAVTLGALLRRAGVDFPVLQEFSALPYRRLAAHEAAPASYPGVVREFDVRRGGSNWRIAIGGGVELVPRWRSGGREAGIDVLAERVERLVDAGDLQRRDAIREPNPVVLARAGNAGSDPLFDQHMTAGSAAFRSGKFGVAATAFRAAAAVDPASVDAYVNLAFSLDRLGRTPEARAAIRTARLLEPADATARLIDFAIRLRADPSARPAGDVAKTFRRLIELYTANALHALRLGSDAQAVAWANDAIRFGVHETPVEAHLVRGLASNASPLGCEDLRRTAGETEYVLSGTSYGNDARLYAFAVLGIADCSVARQGELLRRADMTPSSLRAVTDDLAQTITLIEKAQSVVPRFAPVFTVPLRMAGLRHAFLGPGYSPQKRASEEQRLTAMAAALVLRFPDLGDSYAAAGQLHLDLDNPALAADVCTASLRVRPTDGDCLTVRASAFAALGRCEEAKRDLGIARKNPRYGPIPAIVETTCGK